MSTSAELPKWFTPLRMLCIFTFMSTIVYLDRGLIASTPVNGRPGTSEHKGDGIQGAFDLSNFEDGCLPAAFMAGLLVSAPIFVHFSATVEPFKIVGIGLLIWFSSVFACGLSWNFWSLLICRTLVGVGESSFVILAAPFINEYAPPHLKSVWLAIFLMAIPVGYAIGYIYGAAVGMLLGWRGAFMSAACLMLPMTVFVFLTKPVPLGKAAIAGHGASAPPPPPNGGRHPHGPPVHSDTIEDAEALAAAAAAPGDAGDAVVASLGDGNKLSQLEAAMERADAARHRPGVHRDKAHACGRFADAHANGDGHREAADMSQGLLSGGVPTESTPMRRQTLWLIQRPIFTLAILGNTLHTALLGMFAYWGPKAVTYIFKMGPGAADVLFGAITVGTGIVGTLAGGSLLDATGGAGPRPRHAASRVCLLSVGGGFVVLQAAFAGGRTLAAFCTMFALGEFLLFMIQAPITRIILLEAPTHLQPLAFSLQTISIHVLGDVPSPPLAGLMHDYVFQSDDDKYPNSWRHTCLLFNCVLLGAVAFFAVASLLTRGDAARGGRTSATTYAPVPVEHVGALGVPVHAHPHPPAPSPRGGVSEDRDLWLRDEGGRLAAVNEASSSCESLDAVITSSRASQRLIAEPSADSA